MGVPPFRDDRAEVLGRRAIALDPDLPDGYGALAEVYRQRGSFSRALEHSRRAAALNPRDANAAAELGQLYSDMGRLDVSIPLLKKGVSLDPRTVWPYASLCFTYSLLERLDEGERWCRRGLELQPDFALLHLALGDLYYRGGDLAKAEVWARTAQALDSAVTLMGRVELRRGNLREALEYVRRTSAARAGVEPVIGYIYWRLGEREAAEREFRQVEQELRLRRAQGDESWGPHMQLAVIHATRGQKAQAIRAIEEAIEHGWRDVWLLSTFPPLENLRGERRFQEALAGMRAEVERQRLRVEREDF